jgi:hypothetical protein
MPLIPTPSPRRNSLSDARLLDPPLGYRRLAWLGLLLNVLAVPMAMLLIRADPTWRTTNIVVGAAAVLPTAVVGVVASAALLRWRLWGQVLAIVALSLSLAVSLDRADGSGGARSIAAGAALPAAVGGECGCAGLLVPSGDPPVPALSGTGRRQGAETGVFNLLPPSAPVWMSRW